MTVLIASKILNLILEKCIHLRMMFYKGSSPRVKTSADYKIFVSFMNTALCGKTHEVVLQRSSVRSQLTSYGNALSLMAIGSHLI